MTVNTKPFKRIVITFLLLLGSKAISQQNPIEIEIMPPSVEQEATSVWRTINDIAFFEKQGFQAEGEPFEEAGINHKKMIYLPE